MILDIEKIKENFFRVYDIFKIKDDKFTYKLLKREEIELVNEFLEIIEKTTTYSTFVRDSKEELIEYFEKGGIFLGVFERDEKYGDVLIGVTIAYGLKDVPYLRKYILLERNDLDETMVIDTVAVLPKYRGNLIQSKMMAIMEYLGKKKGYKYIYSTVSPYNYHSLKNYFHLDYVIRRIESLYETESRKGVIRFLVSVDIGKRLEKVQEQYSVLNSDFEGQKEVIDLNFAGMKIINVFSEEKFFISYSKAFYE